MSAKRLAAWTLATLLLSSLVLSQSLSEIAQKERARRAALKGKKIAVITNADLAKMTKKPALEIPPAPASASAQTAPAAPAETSPAEAPGAAASAGVAEAKPGETPRESGPPPAGPNQPATLREIQQRLDKAKEYVELLTLKMGALWQELEGLRDVKTKEAVQLAIGETFAKLQTAQEEVNRAQQDLDKFVAATRKETSTSLWIR